MKYGNFIEEQSSRERWKKQNFCLLLLALDILGELMLKIWAELYILVLYLGAEGREDMLSWVELNSHLKDQTEEYFHISSVLYLHKDPML